MSDRVLALALGVLAYAVFMYFLLQWASCTQSNPC